MSMLPSFFALIVTFFQGNILEIVYYQSIDNSNKKRFESAEAITLNVQLKQSFYPRDREKVYYIASVLLIRGPS